MPQLPCPYCQGEMRRTKRLTFPEGSVKLIYECTVCERARVEEEAPVKVPSEG